MRYAKARYVEHSRDLTYRIYVTDALKVLGRLEVRYYDYIRQDKQEERTPEEIIARISDKLRRAEDESV